MNSPKYLEDDEEDPSLLHDEFYQQIFAISSGNFDVLKQAIDSSQFTHT